MTITYGSQTLEALYLVALYLPVWFEKFTVLITFDWISD